MSEKKYKSVWELRERTKFCLDCKWGDFEVLGVATKGLCRKKPPMPGWPGIQLQDWCSDFSQSKKAKHEEDEIKAENP